MHLHIGHTFFGAGNIGDDLVLAGFLDGISGAPGLRLTCGTRYDIASQRRRFPQIEWSVDTDASRRDCIAACDAWVGIGAGILQPIDDIWLLTDQARQIEQCRRFGKPVFFAGTSAHYRADADRPEVRLLLDSARHVWTRDSLSTAALKRMGFDRVTTASDFSHLALRHVAFPRPADRTAFVCNFERESDYSIALLERLVAAATPSEAAWLVQEIRRLPGSELDIHNRFSPETRQRLELRLPDYAGAAGIAELIGSWDGFDRLFTTRFHGAIIGAWQGSRVVAFERQPKLGGVAEDLGIMSFAAMPDRDALLDAFSRARPVERAALEQALTRAANACTELLKAVASAALEAPELKPMDTTTGSHTLGPTRGGTHAPADPFVDAVTHFRRAADRYHTALGAYHAFGDAAARQALDDARVAAAYALLGLPGSVVRTRLRAPALQLVRAMLGSEVQGGPRAPAEETSFVECWRRYGQSTQDDLVFSCGLALLMMSRNGFELLGLAPLDRELGWTEQLWLRRLIETVPRASLIANTDPSADMLPPAIRQIRDRILALDADARDELLRAHAVQSGADGDGNGEHESALQKQVRMLTEQLKEANADREICHRDILTLTGHLKEANADREACYRDILTLTGHLEEANAGRELCHRDILTLSNHLEEANADRELCHRDILTLTGHLKEANADREVCHRDILTLTGHLEEANAGREVCHRDILALSDHLKEANADRELCRRDILALTGQLREANARGHAISESQASNIASGILDRLSRLIGRTSS
jgi:polysaccharide pyruvyl transferase WcaK-like protein